MKKAIFSLMMVAVLVLSSCMPNPAPTQAPPTETVTGPAFKGAGISASAVAISPDGA